MGLEERNPTPQDAALFIAKILADPEDRQLADVSNISIRMAHPLTMLRALIEQMDVFIDQIRARQRWQVRRYVHQQALLEVRRINYYKKLIDSTEDLEEASKIEVPEKIWTDEYQKSYIDKVDVGIDSEDGFDKTRMFAMDFFLQYCHISRGKGFKLADLLQVLADSEITNRNSEEGTSGTSARAG